MTMKNYLMQESRKNARKVADALKLKQVDGKHSANKEAKDCLKKVAEAMGFKLVIDKYFVYFVKKDDKKHDISVSYGKKLIQDFLVGYVFKTKEFYEGIANPFCGCKSIEEALVLADLVGGKL